MAEQNILAGDIKVLEQIISDVSEHQNKLSEQETLKQNIKDTTKEITMLKKSIEDEIEDKISDGEDAICQGYNKALDVDKEKLKQESTEREKAKLVGVKERIEKETSSIQEENDNYSNQIKATIDQNRLPGICKSKLFYILFYQRTLSDVMFSLLLELVVFLAVPLFMYEFAAVRGFGLIAYYFLLSVLFLNIKKIVSASTVFKAKKVLDEVSIIKDQIKLNKKKMDKIAKSIKNDKNDSVYGLEEYDARIKEIKDDIKKIEAEKAKALEDYDNNTKPNIIAEVNDRNSEKVNELQNNLEKMTKESADNDTLIKDQGIYISTNYEAYLGKEYTSKEKLQELHAILQNEPVQTIAQALAEYKNKD